MAFLYVTFYFVLPLQKIKETHDSKERMGKDGAPLLWNRCLQSSLWIWTHQHTEDRAIETKAWQELFTLFDHTTTPRKNGAFKRHSSCYEVTTSLDPEKKARSGGLILNKTSLPHTRADFSTDFLKSSHYLGNNKKNAVETGRTHTAGMHPLPYIHLSTHPSTTELSSS